MSVELTADLTGQLKARISSGEWEVGSKIPTELELMEEYGVSRNTIREAIKALVALNILEIRRGKGTYVSSSPGITNDPFGLAFVNPAVYYDYMQEVRSIIEPEIAALAAERATTEEIMDMIRIVDQMKDLNQRISTARAPSESLYEQSTQLDIDFHNLLCKMAHNPVFFRIMPIINQAIRLMFTDNDFHRHIKTSIHDSHQDILKAVIQHDAAGARNLIKDHIRIYKGVKTQGVIK